MLRWWANRGLELVVWPGMRVGGSYGVLLSVHVVFSVVVAEAVAARRGLEVARERAVRRVIVEVDSQILHVALLKPCPDLSYFWSVVDDILEFAGLFKRCSFTLGVQ